MANAKRVFESKGFKKALEGGSVLITEAGLMRAEGSIFLTEAGKKRLRTKAKAKAAL